MQSKTIVSILLFGLLVTACNSDEGREGSGAEGETATDVVAAVTEAAPTELPPTAPPAVDEVAPTEAVDDSPVELSFSAVTYRDAEAGFALEHPDTWALDGVAEQQARGSIVQLTEAGEPRLDIVLQRWDPTGDLAAFVEVRKIAWESSGIEILEEQPMTWGADGAAVRFTVRGPEGDEGLFYFAPLGDRYLVLSGGDVPRLTEVVGTLRLLDIEAGDAGGEGAPAETSTGSLSLDCRDDDEAALDWQACNVIDGLRSRNTAALLGYMSDPFAMLYWRSEGVELTPDAALAEIESSRLPADAAAPLTFTDEPDAFPGMLGVDPAGLLGPEVEVVLTLFSQGWGADGGQETLLIFTRDEAGAYRWRGLLLAMDGFGD